MKLGNLKERKNGILPEVPLEFPEVEDGIKTQRYWLRISCETLAYIQMCEKGIAERFHKQYGHEHPTACPLPCWKILYTSIPGNICFPEWNNCVFGGYCTYCKTETKNIHYEKKVRDFYGNNQQ